MLLLARVGDALDHLGAPQGDAVEEAQGRNRDIEAGPRGAGRIEVDLIGPYLCQPQLIWRPVEVPGEFCHGVHASDLNSVGARE